VEPLARTLERLLPPAAFVARTVRNLAIAALAAGLLLDVQLFREQGLGDTTGETVGRLLVAAAVLAPGIVLVLFHRALREVLELPRRLRELPAEGRRRAGELGELVVPEPGGRRPGKLRRAWRLLALSHGTRELLAPYAPLVALLSPGFLTATAVSAFATPVLVVLALVTLA
jgi:hypothetical protein